MPVWVDKQQLKYIHSLAAMRNLVVDHIVPLTNDIVCGLHAPDNLRCISKKMNAVKLNKFDQDRASNDAFIAASQAKWK